MFKVSRPIHTQHCRVALRRTQNRGHLFFHDKNDNPRKIRLNQKYVKYNNKQSLH